MYISASNMIASSLSSSNDTAFSKHFNAFLEKQMTERKNNLTPHHWSYHVQFQDILCSKLVLLTLFWPILPPFQCFSLFYSIWGRLIRSELKSLKLSVNLFHPFLYLLKTTENLWFSLFTGTGQWYKLTGLLLRKWSDKRDSLTCKKIKDPRF